MPLGRGPVASWAYILIKEAAKNQTDVQDFYYYYTPIRWGSDSSYGSFVGCEFYPKLKNEKNNYLWVNFFFQNHCVLALSSEAGNPAERIMLKLDIPFQSSPNERKEMIATLQLAIEMPKELIAMVADYMPGSISDWKNYRPGWSNLFD